MYMEFGSIFGILHLIVNTFFIKPNLYRCVGKRRLRLLLHIYEGYPILVKINEDVQNFAMFLQPICLNFFLHLQQR